jgi:hypothetical protein
MGAKSETDNHRDCATAWFSVLERARATGDRQLAAEAIDNLRRLGVVIQFIPPVHSEATCHA